MKRLLNVGGGSKKETSLPVEFGPVDHIMLDINPESDADLIMDARELVNYGGEKFDIIYCAHCLEHFMSSDLPTLLRGFQHVLNENGVVCVIVPNIVAVLRTMFDREDDLLDVAYSIGQDDGEFPVSYADMLYGSHIVMCGGNTWYHHNYGFSPKSIETIMSLFGFAKVALEENGFDLFYIGRKV